MIDMFAVTLALMVGTAGLPHVIIRFYTVKSVHAARWSAFWALLFIGILYDSTRHCDICTGEFDSDSSRKGLH